MKLQTLASVIDTVTTALQNNTIVVKPITHAPRWLRFWFDGSYCAYGNTVYAPESHFILADSKHEVDNIVAYASILQWLAAVIDADCNVTLKYLYKLRYTKLGWYFFSYTFMMLRQFDHPERQLITYGFCLTRPKRPLAYNGTIQSFRYWMYTPNEVMDGLVAYVEAE